MEGKLKKFRSANYLAEAGQIWGETFLNENSNNRLEDDIIVETESVIIELNLMNIRTIQVNHQSVLVFKSEKKVAKGIDIDLDEINFLYELDKSTDSILILLRHQHKNLLGKLYKKKDIEKNNLMQVVKQEMEVTEIAEHPFLPTFYTLINNDKCILRITEFVQGESLYDSIR
jgi:hypothetical protein